MKTAIASLTLAALIGASATAGAAPKGCGIACLKAQISALKTKNQILSASNLTLKTQVDAAQGDLLVAQTKLETAQTGLPGTVVTMTPADAWNALMPALNAKFNGGRFTTSRYQSGSDYISYTFTFCGFC